VTPPAAARSRPTAQEPWSVRCEWGANGLAELAAGSDAIVIVDVLSFSTCVDVAVGRGAHVIPFAGSAEDAHTHAHAQQAVLAGRRGKPGYSLSPASFARIESGTRVVLSSPNGSALSAAAAAAGPTVFAASLRNAGAVARAARDCGPRIALVPAGERWPDESLRPCLEDWLGAGAVAHSLAELDGPAGHSPEARAAAALFEASRLELRAALRDAASGRELIGQGFAADVDLAGDLDVSGAAPLLRAGAYGDAASIPSR